MRSRNSNYNHDSDQTDGSNEVFGNHAPIVKLEDAPRRFSMSEPKAQKWGALEGPARVKILKNKVCYAHSEHHRSRKTSETTKFFFKFWPLASSLGLFIFELCVRLYIIASVRPLIYVSMHAKFQLIRNIHLARAVGVI